MADEFDDAASIIAGAPRKRVVVGVDANPDTAASHAKLGKELGIPTEAVASDPEFFQKQALSRRNTDVVAANPTVSNYVTRYPDGAEISNDDFFSLVNVSKKMSAVAEVIKGGYRAFTSDEATEGFWRASQFKEDPLGIDPENILKYPGLWTTNLLIATPLDFMMRGGAGGIGYLAGVSSHTMKELGFDNTTSRKVEREVFQVLQAFMTHPMSTGLPGKVPKPAEQVSTIFKEAQEAPKLPIKLGGQEGKEVDAAVRTNEIYDSRPMPGADPLLDIQKFQQNAVDVQALRSLGQAVDEARTKERSPDAMEEFLNVKFKDMRLGIDPKALNKVLDEITDDKLKAKIGEQITEALAQGQDVKLTLPEWFARTTPEVREGLLESTRVRPEGMTSIEAKEAMENVADHPQRFRQIPFEPVAERPDIFVIENAINAEGPTEVRVIDNGRGATALEYPPGSGHLIDVSSMLEKGMDIKEAIARSLGDHPDPYKPEIGKVHTAAEAATPKAGEAKPFRAEIKLEDGMHNVYLDGVMENAFGTRKDAENYLAIYHETAYRTVLNDNIATERAVMALDPLFVKDEPKVVEGKEATTVVGKSRETHFGLTASEHAKYKKLIEEQRAETEAQVFEKAHKAAQRRQTKEWHAEEDLVRTQVENDAKYSTFLADDFFRTDMLPNANKKTPAKLDAKLVDELYGKGTSEQLPKYVTTKKGGAHPDQVAKTLDIDSGQKMIEDLVLLQKDRRESNMNDRAYRQDVIDKEVDRQMTLRHGDLKTNIRAEAIEATLTTIQERALETQIDAIAAQTGKPAPWELADLKLAAKEAFELKIMEDASIFKDFQRATGKKGREVEKALLKGDPETALIAAMQRYTNYLQAREAFQLQKELQSTGRLADRYAKNNTLPGVHQEYTDQVHALLEQLGVSTKRDATELQTALGGESLVAFAAREGHGLGEIPVPDWFSAQFDKDFTQMTVAQFREMRDVLIALDHSGRKAQMIEASFERVAMDKLRERLVEQLERHGEKTGKKAYPLSGVKGPITLSKELGREVLAANYPFRTILQRIEEQNPNGPFTQHVVRRIYEAENRKADLRRQVAEAFQELQDQRGLTVRLDDPHSLALIDNDLFLDRSGNGTFEVMNRTHMYKVALNLGNDSNGKKLVEGHKLVNPASEEFYGASPKEIYAAGKQKALDWLERNGMTKKEWDFVQGVWDIFEDLGKLGDDLQRRVAGVASPKIEAVEVNTPHGKYRGGFIRLDYDSIQTPEIMTKSREYYDITKGEGFRDQGYLRATVPHGYTKERTAFIGALDFDLSNLTWMLDGIIHDIAFREAIMDVGKILTDKAVMKAMTENVGHEFVKMSHGWLKDMANPNPYDMDIMQGWRYASGWMRQNLISSVIGFSPTTVAKHGGTAIFLSADQVGAKNLVASMGRIVLEGSTASKESWNFMMEHSKEMPYRRQHFIDTIAGGQSSAIGQAKDFSSFIEAITRAVIERSAKQAVRPFDMIRHWSIEKGSLMVAISDMVSAAPMWDAAYKKAIVEGANHDNAVFQADIAVVRAHGSMRPSEKSQTIRNLNRSEWGRWATPLINFFSHASAKQVEAAWLAADAKRSLSDGEIKQGLTEGYAATTKMISSLIIPAIIEEIVTPMTNDERKSMGQKFMMSIGRMLTGGFPIVRDIASNLLTGRDPTTGGLIGTSVKSITDAIKETQKVAGYSEKKMTHIFTAMAAMTGIGWAQIGRSLDVFRKADRGSGVAPKEIILQRPFPKRRH